MLRVVELAAGAAVAIYALLIVGMFLPHTLSVPMASALGELFVAALLLAAGALVAFAAYRDAGAGDPSWLRAAGTAALFFVVIVIVGQASIGLLLLPAAALTFLMLLVARQRARPAAR
jgi:hypothetical protein